MKVNITLDDALMEKVDSHAKNLYMSRSGFISIACAQYINSFEIISCMKEMSLAFKKIADTAELDDDTMRKLEQLESTFRLLSNSNN